MTEAKLTKKIVFRLTDTEYARVNRVASTTGGDPNAWCRSLALKQSSESQMFTRDEQLVYEEIATLNFLAEPGDKSLAWTNGKLMYEWKMLRQQADENATEITQELVRRRKPASRKR